MALSALTKPLCVARGVGWDSLAGGREPGSRHLHGGGEGPSVSSWDMPGPPGPAQVWSQPRAVPCGLHNSLLIPKEKKGSPCPRHCGHTGRLWAEPVLVSAGSWSPDGWFLPSGTRTSRERSVIIVTAAVICGVPAVFSGPGDAHPARHPLLRERKGRRVSSPPRSPERVLHHVFVGRTVVRTTL